MTKPLPRNTREIGCLSLQLNSRHIQASLSSLLLQRPLDHSARPKQSPSLSSIPSGNLISTLSSGTVSLDEHLQDILTELKFQVKITSMEVKPYEQGYGRAGSRETPHFPFLSLPGEMRNEIYDLTLPRGKIFHYHGDKRIPFAFSIRPLHSEREENWPWSALMFEKTKTPELYIMKVNHQIHEECIQLLIQNNIICMMVHSIPILLKHLGPARWHCLRTLHLIVTRACKQLPGVKIVLDKIDGLGLKNLFIDVASFRVGPREHYFWRNPFSDRDCVMRVSKEHMNQNQATVAFCFKQSIDHPVYKMLKKLGIEWKEYPLDKRFEDHSDQRETWMVELW